MGHNLRLDYGAFVKRGIALGVALVLFGFLGADVGTVVLGGLPAWEVTLFTDMEILGIVVGFVAVFGFGILLPLTE